MISILSWRDFELDSGYIKHGLYKYIKRHYI